MKRKRVRNQELARKHRQTYLNKRGEEYAKQQRAYKLRVRYGLSEEEFERLCTEQRGICPGCLEEKPLCVDHCHITGKVRGLLCKQCNATIGFAKEDINLLKNLVSYLETNGRLD